MLSADQVRTAIGIWLDEAVPDGPVLDQLRALPSLEDLHRIVMATEAYQARLPRPPERLPLTAPALSIERTADSATMAALLALVRAKWRQLGQEKPHWSVIGQNEFLPEHLSGNEAAFERTGEADVDIIRAFLARHGLSEPAIRHVFDFGCGVGRVTFPLAARFPRVTGSDVSDAHLSVGRDTAIRRGVKNVDFRLADAPDFGMTEPFHLWYSRLVLQHNPPPIIAMILRRMFALLAPGGTAIFQLPTYLHGYRFDGATYLQAPPAESFEIHVLPQPDVFALAREAGCDVLEVREDASVWPPSEVISNVFLFRKRPV